MPPHKLHYDENYVVVSLNERARRVEGAGFPAGAQRRNALAPPRSRPGVAQGAPVLLVPPMARISQLCFIEAPLTPVTPSNPPKRNTELRQQTAR